MNFFGTLVQAIIQGFTEFLPVSSSGHLSIIQHLMGSKGADDVFLSIMLHFGTLVAIFIAFWSTIKPLMIDFVRMILKIFTGKFKASSLKGKERLILMLLLSLVPALVIVVFKDFFESFAADSSIMVEGFCFLITAALLYFASKTPEGKTEEKDIKPRQALAVGASQILAAFPGVSRSGTTISTGLFAGFKRELAVTYSFLLGVPAILAAGLSELLDVIKGDVPTIINSAGDVFTLLFCMAVSAVVGIISIKFVKMLVVSNKFKIFAYYTLCLGIVVIVIAIAEISMGHAFTPFG